MAKGNPRNKNKSKQAQKKQNSSILKGDLKSTITNSNKNSKLHINSSIHKSTNEKQQQYQRGGASRNRKRRGLGSSNSFTTEIAEGNLQRLIPNRNHPFHRGFFHKEARVVSGRSCSNVIEDNDNVNFKNEQASLYQREMAKARSAAAVQQQQIQSSAGPLHFQEATFRLLRDSEKTTSQLIRETVEEMNDVGFTSSPTVRPSRDNNSLLREDISKLTFEPLCPGGSATRTRSLDGMLALYDGEDEQFGDTSENDLMNSKSRKLGSSKSSLSKAEERSRRFSSSWSSTASAQFQRQRFFQLQQMEDAVGGSNTSMASSGSLLLTTPASPIGLERSLLTRSIDSRDNNPFALLEDGDDDDGNNDSCNWRGGNREDRPSGKSQPLFAFQPATFEVLTTNSTNNCNINHDSYSSSGSGGNPVNAAFSNTIIEETENEEDDDL